MQLRGRHKLKAFVVGMIFVTFKLFGIVFNGVRLWFKEVRRMVKGLLKNLICVCENCDQGFVVPPGSAEVDMECCCDRCEEEKAAREMGVSHETFRKYFKEMER